MKNEVKERPILFSGAMVRAILDGRKSQTRRIVKLWREDIGHNDIISFGQLFAPENCPTPVKYTIPTGEYGYRTKWDYCDYVKCPYGNPGDTLYVKETFAKTGDNFHDDWPGHGKYYYRADDPYSELEPDSPTKGIPKWRASIYMPREASRIRLLIEDIGVERLNDISQSDAVSEGIESSNEFNSDEGYLHQYKDYIVGDYELDAICSYQTLWESINGKGSWDANPWVWIIKFKRL